MVNQKKTWLPKDYEVPKSSGAYMKFDQGANKFRILTAPVIGWEYWNKENKPRRVREELTTLPEDIRYETDKSGAMRPTKVKHFWAFGVWSYKEGKVMILEITQSGIQQEIQDLVVNPDWGDPTMYDITINRKGEGLESKYTVQPSPHKITPPEALTAIEETPLNLEALFEGDDPFELAGETETQEVTEEESII